MITMKLKDLLLKVYSHDEVYTLKLLDGVNLNDEVKDLTVKNDPDAYYYRYMLFSYNTSNFRLTNSSTKEENFLLRNIILEIKFKNEVSRAQTEEDVLAILNKQYLITELEDIPKTIWLKLVGNIIEKNNLLHFDIAKHNAVKRWFKKRREEINLNKPKSRFDAIRRIPLTEWAALTGILGFIITLYLLLK